MQILPQSKNAKHIIKAWIDGVEIDNKAIEQLNNIAEMPFIHHHIAAMPDVHWGMGATVGSVIPTKGAIIPAAVGVDIGCGMMAIQFPITASQLPENLYSLRCAIEAAIPHGRTDNGGINDKGAWKEAQEPIDSLLKVTLSEILEKHSFLSKWTLQRAFRHLGTLGTGNHFIEICLDESNFVWVMLHSGSRGIGNAIGSYFIEKAKKDMERWFIRLPDQDLAYISEGSALFDDYITALNWAQEFALENRIRMMQKVLQVVHKELKLPFILYDPSREIQNIAINCHHNYVAKENHYGSNVWITRKGALRARKNDLGIIPGSMGAKSFIVRGLGNPESFQSCSHGAGRVMSRNQAKREVSLEQHILDTQNVECRKDQDVIDETPKAYKNIDAVMAAQNDLVEIVHTLKQILCVKG
jgi:tRNA-splicing ligase RtcB